MDSELKMKDFHLNHRLPGRLFVHHPPLGAPDPAVPDDVDATPSGGSSSSPEPGRRLGAGVGKSGFCKARGVDNDE